MKLAEQMLAPGGIVAVDDIMNPTCPGVVEAVIRYSIESQDSLAPLAIVGNKLFMTQKSDCDRFRQTCWSCAELAKWARRASLFSIFRRRWNR